MDFYNVTTLQLFLKNSILIKSTILQVFNKNNGKQLWSEVIGGCGMLASYKNYVLLLNQSNKHEIIAMNIKTGKKITSLSLPNGSCSGIVIEKTKGYLSTNNGIIYAVNLF